LANPGPDRILYVADAFRTGFSALKKSTKSAPSIRGFWRKSKTL
jgi:hypothetical protein